MAFAFPSASACSGSRRQHALRGGLLLAALLSGLLTGRLARAEAPPPVTDRETRDLKNRCADAYESTQRQRARGHLLKSREDANFCAQTACPELLRSDCRKWASELSASIPALVVETRAADGALLVDVQAFLDGQPFAASLDGRAREVEPGRHVLRLSGAGLVASEQVIVVVQGNQAQRVRLTLQRTATQAPLQRAKSIPAVSYALAGLSAAGMASFAYFGLAGNAKKSDLESCRPGCASSLRGPIERDYLVADVSLGVSLAALGFAAWTALRGQAEAPEASGFQLETRQSSARLSYQGSF